MKIKSIICLVLSLIIILGLSACQTSELNIEGGDTYYYSSEETTSVEDSSDVSSNETSSKKTGNTDWDSVIDGEEPYYFIIKNSMDIEIEKVGYRPKGYKKYKMINIDIDVNDSKPIEFSQGDVVKYQYFEFVFVSNDGKRAELNPLLVNGKKGLELLYMNGGYSHEYLK